MPLPLIRKPLRCQQGIRVHWKTQLNNDQTHEFTGILTTTDQKVECDVKECGWPGQDLRIHKVLAPEKLKGSQGRAHRHEGHDRTHARNQSSVYGEHDETVDQSFCALESRARLAKEEHQRACDGDIRDGS